MMYERGYPDESWTEELLLSLIENNIEDASPEARHKRIAGLNELSQREIVNKERMGDVLINVAKRYCKRPPESEIIIQVLSRLANSSEDVFQKLLAESGKGEPDALLYCIFKIIRNLDADKRNLFDEVLLKVLMSKKSFTHTTDEMCKTLILIGETKREEVVRLTRPYLKLPDPYNVAFATGIVSPLADEQLTNDFCEIIKNSLKKWYSAPEFRERIQKESCKFFIRVKDKNSFDCLLELLEKESNPYIKEEAEETLACLIDDYPEFLNELMKTKIPYPLKLKTLVKLKETKVDKDALSKLVPPEDLEKSSIRNMLNKIAVKADDKHPVPTGIPVRKLTANREVLNNKLEKIEFYDLLCVLKDVITEQFGENIYRDLDFIRKWRNNVVHPTSVKPDEIISLQVVRKTELFYELFKKQMEHLRT